MAAMWFLFAVPLVAANSWNEICKVAWLKSFIWPCFKGVTQGSRTETGKRGAFRAEHNAGADHHPRGDHRG